MRKRGVSTRDVEKRLGIPRSTLSYWFRRVTLHPRYQKRMVLRHEKALVKARTHAVRWHNAQKANRLALAREEALASLKHIDMHSDAVAELALALLYLGEGAKKTEYTAIGNSSPLILRFFIAMLQRLYKIEIREIKCELHLRADQNPVKLTKYWSKTLGIPLSNFRKPSLDQRTVGRPTYPDYKGVCIVCCGRVAIQRKLVYIATTFCEKMAGGMRG